MFGRFNSYCRGRSAPGRGRFRGGLLTALGLLVLQNALLAVPHITANIATGTPNTYSDVGFTVHNQTASAITLTVCKVDGTHAGAGGIIYPDMSGSTWSPGWSGTNLLYWANGTSNATAIPAGATRWVKYDTIFQVPSSGGVIADGNPEQTLSWVVHYKENGGATKTATLGGRKIQFTKVASPPATDSLVATGIALMGTGVASYTAGGTASNSTTVTWGNIELGAPPAVGDFTLKGLEGNFIAHIWVDGTLVASADQIPSPSTALTPHADLNWHVTNPAAWVGKYITWDVNGSDMPVSPGQLIALDGTGGFAYEYTAVEYYQLIRDIGVETEVPLPGDEMTTDTINESEDHVRDAPGPIDGTDPKTDTTVDSDGAGSGVGLSVKDMYRAMRAANEDSLHPKGDFNFDEWRGQNTLGTSSTHNGAGSAMGDAVLAGAASLVVANAAMNVPGLAGADPLVLKIAGTSFALPLHSSSSWVRLFLLFWLCFFVYLAGLALLKSAMAGK